MPTATMAPPANRAARRANGPQQAAVAPRPFVAGSRLIDEPIYDQTKVLTTSTQDLPSLQLDPNGFLRGLFLLVEGTTGNTNAVTAFNADGPFNVLDLVNFQDTNSQPMFGPFNGWDNMACDKWGGYAFQDDPRMSPIYTVTVGAGATGGSFTFALYIPAEIVRRHALGSLPNKSSSSTFSLNLRLSNIATLYSTAPNGTGTSVRVRILEMGWQDPNMTDIRNNPVAQDPPGVNTTQYWVKQSPVINSGALNFRLDAVDGFLRNLLIIARDENNSRQQGDSEFPDPFILQYETAQVVNRLKTLWQHFMARDYGYTAAVETAGGRDYGVYPLHYCQDFYAKPGYETGYSYLPVSSASNLVMRGTVGGTGANAYGILINRVVPAGGNPLVLTGR